MPESRFDSACMPDNKLRKINKLLDESGPLASQSGRERVARIQTLLAAMDMISQEMGLTSLSLHSAGFRTLTLSVPDGASATRLRYRNRELLATIKRISGLDIARISIRVVPESKTADPDILPRQLQSCAADHLISASQYVDDPELSAALLKLSKRASKD